MRSRLGRLHRAAALCLAAGLVSGRVYTLSRLCRFNYNSRRIGHCPCQLDVELH